MYLRSLVFRANGSAPSPAVRRDDDRALLRAAAAGRKADVARYVGRSSRPADRQDREVEVLAFHAFDIVS